MPLVPLDLPSMRSIRGKGARIPAPVFQESHSSCRRSGENVRRQDRHFRQSARRLKAVAKAVHSAATLARPRSRNLTAFCYSLTMPKTGSTSCFLSLYTSLAPSVDIQAR